MLAMNRDDVFYSCHGATRHTPRMKDRVHAIRRTIDIDMETRST
jgi:hypothetical protein